MSLAIEDKFAITELIHRLGRLLDVRDVDGVIACLTPDFKLVIPEGTLGLEQYRQLIEGAEAGVPHQHWAGNVLVEGDGDRATANTYVLCPEGPRDDGSYGVLLMGTADYSAVRVDGGWAFDQLSIKRDKLFSLPA